jgi:hypothetical protein
LTKLYGPEKAPKAFIQWKGTDVCMDVACLCGETAHVCQDFVYALHCTACGRKYAMPSHIALHPITDEEAKEYGGTLVQFPDADELAP